MATPEARGDTVAEMPAKSRDACATTLVSQPTHDTDALKVTHDTDDSALHSPRVQAESLSPTANGNGHVVRDRCGSGSEGAGYPEDVGGPPTPPDGGYGWVILASSFFINFLVDGVCFSFGIFFVEFLDYFGASRAKTSWIGSILNGMYLFMGPVVGSLVNRFGCRAVTISGSMLATAAFLLSTLSPNVNVMILTYGAMGSAGFGLMYLPAIVMVGFYFERRRACATGVAVCGSGIGAFVFAPLCELLLNTYGWQGATWVIAGLVLNGAVCGAIFRPLQATPQQHAECEQSDPVTSLSAEGLGGTTVASNGTPQPKDLLRQRLLHSLEGAANGAPQPTSCVIKSMQDLSASSVDHPHSYPHPTTTLSRSCEWTFNKDCVEHSDAKRRAEELRRPLARKDIFYSGSVQHLAEYKECGDRDSYIRSVTDVPSDTEHSPRHECARTLRSAWRSLRTMMDFSLLSNPVFLIYGASCFLCMTGFFVPFIFLPDMALDFGMARSQAAFLISIIGIANTVARVAAGWVSDQPWADCLVVNNIALILGGGATMLCPFCTSYALLATYSFVFGCCIAAFVSLRSIIMVDLMGIDKLTNAFGLVTMCQGLSAFIGAPIAGALKDATGTYNISFYVAGSTLAAAGAICIPLRRVAAWQQAREAKGRQAHPDMELDVPGVAV